jgi:hypothetical protein
LGIKVIKVLEFIGLSPTGCQAFAWPCQGAGKPFCQRISRPGFVHGINGLNTPQGRILSPTRPGQSRAKSLDKPEYGYKIG